MGVLLERHAHTELSKALLALSGIASVEAWLIISSGRPIADEAAFILGVEEIEDFADQLQPVIAEEFHSPGNACIHLRERCAAKRVHVADPRRQIEFIAIAVEIYAGPIGVWRCGAIANNARDADAE